LGGVKEEHSHTAGRNEEQVDEVEVELSVGTIVEL